MLRRVILAALLAGMAAAASCGPMQGGTEHTAPLSRQASVPGEYLVTLAPGSGVDAIAAVYGRFGIKRTQSIGHNTYALMLANDPGMARMQELCNQDARINSVQPSFNYHSAPMHRPGAR